MAARAKHALLAAAGIFILASWLLMASATDGSAAPAPQTTLAADNRQAQECASIAIAGEPPPVANASAPDRCPIVTDPAEHPAVPDSEWLLLPKSQGDALLELIWAPQYANAKRLLRSTTFNPRDQCLPVSCRRAVASTIAEQETTIRELTAEFTATEDREFAGLNAKGLANEVDFGLYEGAPQLMKIGADPVFRVLSGKTWGVSKARMPETRRAEALLRDAAAALVARLVEVFAAAHALTTTERAELATRARAAADPNASPVDAARRR